MQKQIVFFLMLISSNLYLPAQNNLDSLEKAIYQSSDNKEKVDALNKLSWEFEYNEPDKAIQIATNAMVLAKNLNYKKGVAQSLNDIGACYYIQGKTENALKFYIESLKIKEEIKDERGVGISFINIGQVYSDQDQFDKSLEYYQKALKQFVKINNQAEMAATFNSIGTLYKRMERPDSAKIYIEKSLVIRKQINDMDGMSECYGNLATIYKSTGDFNKAIEYYELDKEYNEKTGNEYSGTITMNNLSLLYFELNDIDKAILTAKKSAEISEKNGYLENLKYALGNLASFYRKKQDYATAYHYLAEYFSVHDSLKNESLSRSLNDMSVKYETEKKDQQNKLLQTQNDLSEKTIKQQNTQFYFIGSGLLIALGFTGFVVRSNHQKQKYNVIITQQKSEVEIQKLKIEEHQKETIDSINYAKRIQYALLANDDLLKQNLPEYFVFFKPKDIVSGDFYWATEHDNKFYLAVCDSTGHGVPGAFMSLLNMGFMTEAIKEKNISRPNEVLNFVRKRLIDSIGNDGQKDGMDAILICIDKNQSDLSEFETITYAAANNVPVLIRDKEIIELPKDKMPVGEGEKTGSFTLQTINCQKGDTLYLYTDGYADQFGGPKGKKFKYKPLNELLLSNRDLSMIEQERQLDESLNNWMGNLEQVDDVCVIGIKI